MCSLYEKKKQSTMQMYVTNNKKSWKTIKPCFSDKPKISERIFLIQKTKWYWKMANIYFKCSDWPKYSQN